ncbi:NADH-quinone oxidoreductase subunit J [Luteolibacter flavescens]|uniref:NADH-quinone oxidoreductase subunit J n=1 Tax=Luteolibacter flavescens TaxID=1859460 RepID=A0ABT3FIJ5_9BACT|nr:NADH-quinone oxidoreductase subunit J [Luteolibacter flavescens]MCW1883380.1 NADH-quinone oxidoreductase subunit J [Luteolibacter flavescens]
MPVYLFWFFALVMLFGGVAVVALRNPVASALSMVASFVGLSGLFIGLNAFFVGIIQILVYAGAIMVLFIFIIMLLDLKTEEKRAPKLAPLLGGLGIVLAFTIQLIGILSKSPNIKAEPLDLAAGAAYYAERSPGISTKLAEGHLPDVNLIGETLFRGYNLPLQIVGVLLLVSTVGVVVLSKRQTT